MWRPRQAAAVGGRRLLLLPPAPVQLRLLLALLYIQMGDKNLIIVN